MLAIVGIVALATPEDIALGLPVPKKDKTSKDFNHSINSS